MIAELWDNISSHFKDRKMVNTTQIRVSNPHLHLNISSCISYQVNNTRLLLARSLKCDNSESNHQRRPGFVVYPLIGWVSYVHH
jgi:hypothetical protein